MLSRRNFLKVSAATGAVVAAGCHHQVRSLFGSSLPDKIEPAGRTGSEAFRLINRVGFGPTPGQVAQVEQIGRERFIEQQLSAELEPDAALQSELSRLDIFNIESAELRDLPEGELLRQLKQSALLRAVYDPNQLRERMVEFWSNHFNLYGRKAFVAWRKPADELQVIRDHALGYFPEMLRQSAKSPAMLEYLDNQVNEVGTANENYARELMELHTLGVHGGYAQQDVQEVARCFTGWTIENRFLRPRGRFRFDENLHDDGEKTVLGHNIPAGGGIKDGEAVLNILANHPSTARFIATKLCKQFLGDASDTWVNKIAGIYERTKGDIRAMLRPLLLSEEIISGPPIAKMPFEFVASALRALHVSTNAGSPINRHLEAMGQPSYEWPMPDGYPYETEAWTGSLLARWNFAAELVRGQIGGTHLDLPDLQKRTTRTFTDAVREWTLGDSSRQLPKCDTDEQAVLACLCAPEFHWR